MRILTAFFCLTALTLAADEEKVACGRRNKPTKARAVMKPIIGGEPAAKHEFPWMVGLTRKKDSAFIGGGTLISAKWVLTAAHSVNYSEFLNISGLVAGSHSPDDDGKTVQRRSALRKIIHPGFKYKYHDIALVEVDKPFKLSQDSVAPACLPDGDGSDDKSHTCYATGWGAHEMGKKHKEKEDFYLHKAKLHLISNGTCQAKYKDYGKIDLSLYLCAENDKGDGVCFDDSGGPLTCKTEGTFKVVGVTALCGADCNATEHPSGFSKVSSYRSWIDEQMALEEDPSATTNAEDSD